MNFTENEFGTSSNTNSGVNSTPNNNYNQPVETITQSNSFTPQTNNTYDSNGFKQQSNNSGNNENIKKIVIGIVAVAVVIGGFFGIKSLLSGSSTTLDAASLNRSTAFAIGNSSDKNAIFNNDGKRLTDFIYKYVDGFFNGTAIVTTENGDDGLISQSGKMIIPVGKYTSISEYGGLYKLTDKNYNYTLSNSSGKIVSDLKTEKLAEYFDNYYVMLESDNNYIFMNYNGVRFLTIAKNKTISSEPVTDETDSLLSIFYNGKNYIYDAITGKKVIEFAADIKYCVSDNNMINSGGIILQSCKGNEFYNDSKDYKYVLNGSIKFESKDECSPLQFNSGSIICTYNSNENKIKIYDENGNKTVGMDWYTASYNSFNSYVKNVDSGNGVEFYENGKLIKTVDCFEVGDKAHTYKNIYVLSFSSSSTCVSTAGKYEQYFKSNGTPLNDEKFQFAYNFDENGLAIVKKIVDKKYVYSLINTTGKVIAKDYLDITNASFVGGSSEYYIVTKGDTDALINTKGEVLISAKKIPTYKKVDGTIYFVLNKNDKDSTIYNVKTKKEVLTVAKDFKWNDNYIEVTSGTKTEYYTYTGKLFYTN